MSVRMFGSSLSILLLLVTAFRAQNRPSSSFEAASIKTISDASGQRGLSIDPGHLSIRAPLLGIISKAYGVDLYQVVNLPEWARVRIYDIEAIPAEPTQPEQMFALLRALLGERFRLPSFRSINSDAPLSTGPGTHVKTMPPLVGMIRALIQAGNTPVLDQTGLTGTYDICLDLHRLQAGSHDPEDYVALIKDELGLKVALARVPLKMIVIDHLAQPSAN